MVTMVRKSQQKTTTGVDQIFELNMTLQMSQGEAGKLDPDAYLADERFHRTFILPAGSGRESPTPISYSDFGYRNDANPGEERVVLFCSPLFGSRLLHIAKDKLAKRHHIRIICPDRPGFGTVPDVEAKGRVGHWLVTVPALLEHLHIRHVSLVAHSAGSVYLLNTLMHLRRILDPRRPYAALCAPWIHPSHTGATAMELASILPSVVLKRFNLLAQFIQSSVMPAIGVSASISGSMSGSLMHSSNPTAPVASADPHEVELEEQLRPKIMKRAYSEKVEGLSQDAILLLKQPEDWGSWADCDGYISLLADNEAAFPRGPELQPLRVEVFFSESDIMIGNSQGTEWWNECWGHAGPNVIYKSTVVPNADHDGILDLRFGVAQAIFGSILGSECNL